MFNWSLLTPRNIAVIGAMGALAYFLFTFVSARMGKGE